MNVSLTSSWSKPAIADGPHTEMCSGCIASWSIEAAVSGEMGPSASSPENFLLVF